VAVPTIAPPPRSSSTTTATGENLTARRAGVRTPPVAADSRRDARDERIDLADAGSVAAGNAAAAARGVCCSADLVADLLLQSSAFRMHANGATLVFFAFLLLFLPFFFVFF
jgi:hypothetical protein